MERRWQNRTLVDAKRLQRVPVPSRASPKQSSQIFANDPAWLPKNCLRWSVVGPASLFLPLPTILHRIVARRFTPFPNDTRPTDIFFFCRANRTLSGGCLKLL